MKKIVFEVNQSEIEEIKKDMIEEGCDVSEDSDSKEDIRDSISDELEELTIDDLIAIRCIVSDLYNAQISQKIEKAKFYRELQ
jgi:hypothetical protein